LIEKTERQKCTKATNTTLILTNLNRFHIEISYTNGPSS